MTCIFFLGDYNKFQLIFECYIHIMLISMRNINRITYIITLICYIRKQLFFFFFFKLRVSTCQSKYFPPSWDFFSLVESHGRRQGKVKLGYGTITKKFGLYITLTFYINIYFWTMNNWNWRNAWPNSNCDFRLRMLALVYF